MGQFFDLIELFCHAGDCPETSFVFMGNFSNRGFEVVETISLLLALKLRYPHRMTLLRGLHETRANQKQFGAEYQMLKKYGHSGVFDACMEAFKCLPMAALVNESIFCCPGGPP